MKLGSVTREHDCLIQNCQPWLIKLNHLLNVSMLQSERVIVKVTKGKWGKKVANIILLKEKAAMEGTQKLFKKEQGQASTPSVIHMVTWTIRSRLR